MILQPLFDFWSLSVVLKSKLVKETAEKEKEREVCFVIFIQLKRILNLDLILIRKCLFSLQSNKAL